MSYLSIKKLVLVAPVIYSIAYLGSKYFSLICFGGATFPRRMRNGKEA